MDAGPRRLSHFSVAFRPGAKQATIKARHCADQPASYVRPKTSSNATRKPWPPRCDVAVHPHGLPLVAANPTLTQDPGWLAVSGGSRPMNHDSRHETPGKGCTERSSAGPYFTITVPTMCGFSSRLYSSRPDHHCQSLVTQGTSEELIGQNVSLSTIGMLH